MSNRCGILLAGGNGTRLSPLTKSINKHLLPVYDKPMVFYPLSTLMMAGIRDIAVVTRSIDVDHYKNLLGDGSGFGISLTFLVQDQANGIPEGYVLAKKFVGDRDIALILGDNILAVIPVTSKSFNICFDNGNNLLEKKREYYGPVNIQRLKIQLLNQYGEVLNLNSMDFSFSLEFEIGYDW